MNQTGETEMPHDVSRLRKRLAEITDVRNAAYLLEWDQQTMMPPGGAPARAEALGTLEGIHHELFVAAETGRLLDQAGVECSGGDPDSDDARLVRVTRRRWEKARRVPIELAAEIARAGSVGTQAWIEARSNSDYAAFAPYLEHNIELARRYVDCFDGYECAYDVLLDDFDPGMKTAEVASLFAELKSELIPLISRVMTRSIDDSCLYGSFPIETQRQFVAGVVALMGFDHQSWRLDDSVHPFALSLSSRDVRITTRWDEGFFPAALYGAMHECGHGLYEAGVADSLQRTPIGTADSLGLHESQSRLWENMVGRGHAFSGVLAPMITESFQTPLDADTLYRAVNRVEPSLIRVEADEATYGLHVVLRFELEQELIDGALQVTDLPEAWNSRVKEFLGLEVPNDALGVLQDVHWASGSIGYFPTYALGNLIAGALWERAHEDLPELGAAIAAGELYQLREWLRENVHRHGAKFSTTELLERVVGEPIKVAPFVSYLKRKLGDVYGIDLAGS